MATLHEHVGADDPLFRPVAAGIMAFDARAAVASIKYETGGPGELVLAHRQQSRPTSATDWQGMGQAVSAFSQKRKYASPSITIPNQRGHVSHLVEQGMV